MIGSILIIAFSLVMFLYWFRYTCLLILQTKTADRYAGRIATANRLAFPEVQESLKSADSHACLDPLRSQLDRDFQVVKYLLQHASGLGGRSLEQQLLLVDFYAMRVWYRIARVFWPAHARHALDEMSKILAYFAGVMGQRAAAIY